MIQANLESHIPVDQQVLLAGPVTSPTLNPSTLDVDIGPDQWLSERPAVHCRHGSPGIDGLRRRRGRVGMSGSGQEHGDRGGRQRRPDGLPTACPAIGSATGFGDGRLGLGQVQ